MGNFDTSIGKIRVLFFAANPLSTDRLQLDEEIRLIEERIRLTGQQDSLELIRKLATRPNDLLQELNRYKPQIVHFSGHGESTGEILLVDQFSNPFDKKALPKPVSPQAIRALLATLKDNIRVVMLNACYSYMQATAITEVVDCAIGMNAAIGDRAAIIFSSTFYQAIGFERSVQEAFDQGIAALMLEGISEEHIPKLHVKRGVNPSSIIILDAKAIFSDQESQKLLQSAQNALERGDYNLAGKNAEKVLEIADDDTQPEKTAQARFLQALVTLDGKRPFSQKLSVIRIVENMLSLAITLNPSFSYLLMLAMCKRDFARNGYPQFLAEAHNLILRASQMNQTPQDKRNLELLAICQPKLTNDFLR
ncbi:MAG TPA: hypothetical protein VNG51_29705 [Ktedonobacteraceae bacterium]|nr:hypothetical protein [Ktedonobacteraceae bacterium]